MEETNKPDVYHTMGCMISILETAKQKNHKNTALLAALRNSVGKPLPKAREVWPFLFEHLPERFLSRTAKPTCEENSIFTALQIYAICEQGTSHCTQCDEKYCGSMGKSLAAGRSSDVEKNKGLDRRFNAMITASTYEEFVYHLRQMVRIVRSKETMTINFSKLAEDLYWYQKNGQDEVCFHWATDYYARINEDIVENNREEKTHE